MSTNRGMVKWAPFAAVAPGSVMVNEVLAKKNKVKMPILSEDQIEDINNKITQINPSSLFQGLMGGQTRMSIFQELSPNEKMIKD